MKCFVSEVDEVLMCAIGSRCGLNCDVFVFRQAFSKLTSAVRRSILKLMVLKTVEEDNTVVINNGEEVRTLFVLCTAVLKIRVGILSAIHLK